MPIIIPGNRLASTGYTIDQSIRFNSGDSTYMQRTHGAGGNVDLFTVSFWFKRSILGTEQYLFGSGSSASNTSDIMFNTSNQLTYWQYIGAYQTRLVTTQVFRDVSAWYHVVINYDSGNAASTERARMYINGERIRDFGTETYPSQNQDGVVGSNVAIGFGRYISYGGSYFNGYLAEMHYVNGYGYGPEYFGEFNDSGIWIPKEYSESYGTGGFKVDGRDSSDLGDDESGNGNDLTTSGLNSYDKRNDSPTKNFATWNPLTGTAQTYTNGNLKATTASSAWKGGLTTMQVPLNSGTWYYEWYVTSAGSSSGQMSIGWAESNRSITDDNSSGDTEGWITYAINGNYYARSGTGSYGASYTTGDVIGCKINTNTSSNNVEWYKNGASQGTRSEAFNLGGTGFISPYVLLYGSRDGIARFDNIDWTQTPSGITEDNAINSINLGS
jgi:hypothetical protein